MDISVEIGLPPIDKMRLHSEVDFYGLSTIIAKELDFSNPPRSFATWRHGWVFTPRQFPAQFIWVDHDAPFHLVGTEKEASFLAGMGIGNVVAAGMPFIYADRLHVERIPGSLLVMPPHSLSYSEMKCGERAYVDYVKQISHHFSKVVFCVHQDCAKSGAWFTTLNEFGFDWVLGASTHDINSLQRMQQLFRTFEYMTTNTIGSHLLYGAYCGCKVSISGGVFEYQKSVFKNDPFYNRYPEILDHNLEHSSEEAIRAKYPFLFSAPLKAIPLDEWANDKIGASCRKSPEELQKILGWDWPGQLKLRRHILKNAFLRIIDRPTKVYQSILKRRSD